MTAERWHQIENLFVQAVECPPSERQLLLDRVCRGDEDLRRELESLLACDAPDERLVEIPDVLNASASENGDSGQHLVGRRIGPYRLTRLIGHGGMGAVYLGVRDDDQYQKQVAIKLLKRGMDTDFMLSRFRQERQILANLEHPFIARLIDGGATEDGLPYFVMEFVEGVPITQYCTDKNLSIPERLRLFRLVCEAVQYAHQNLVVHRDIKPSNILTTKEGIPKLLDFGIAKVLDPAGPAATLTRGEFRALTPDYASPEQVKGLQVSTASDTYSLGAVLYELLSGQRPHRFSSNSLADIEKAICEVEVEKPSIAAGKPVSRQLSGDLDNIVLTAMRKEPQRRYASAAEFSEDLRRHMEALPIVAQEDRWSYRAGKFIRRNRLAVGAAVLIAASLVSGIVATTIQARRAERRFELARQLAQAVVREVNGPMARVPGSTAASASMIQTVLRYLDGLAQDPGTDPAFDFEIAATYRNIANVQGNPFQANLGLPAEALVNYQKAISRYEKVYGSSGISAATRAESLSGIIGTNIEAGNIERRSGAGLKARARLKRMEALAAEATLRDPGALTPGALMYLYFRLGNIEQDEGTPQQAMVYFRKAIDVGIKWDAAKPSVNSRSSLRGAYVNLAGTQLIEGDLSAARENYELVLRLVEQAVRQPDTTVLERSSMASAHENLGDLMGNPDDLNFGDHAAAVSHYRRAIEIVEAIAAADREDVRAQDVVAGAYRSFGIILMAEQPVEALKLYQRAQAISEKISSIDPSNTRYRRDIALSQMGTAESLHGLARDREALPKLTSALESMRSLAAADPGQIPLIGSVGRIYRDLGDVWLALGDEKGALKNYMLALNAAAEPIRRAPANLYYQRQHTDAVESLGRYYAKLAERRRELKPEALRWLEMSLAFWRNWTSRGVAVPYAGVRERQVATLIASVNKL